MSGAESYDLPAVAGAIAEARTIVVRAAEGLPESVAEDAALLVSELMSNVVRHGGGSARLTVTLRDDVFVVALHDDGAEMPAMRLQPFDASFASGRGLQIVDRIAARWGFETRDDGLGKTVWFELALAPGTTASVRGNEAPASAGTQINETADRDGRRAGTDAGTGSREDHTVWS